VLKKNRNGEGENPFAISNNLNPKPEIQNSNYLNLFTKKRSTPKNFCMMSPKLLIYYMVRKFFDVKISLWYN